MKLIPEHQLDPTSEASMKLITLNNELRRQKRIADYGRTGHTQAAAARQIHALNLQIAAHKKEHGIA